MRKTDSEARSFHAALQFTPSEEALRWPQGKSLDLRSSDFVALGPERCCAQALL